MGRWISKLVIRHTSTLAKLARAPIIGPVVRRMGDLAVPRERREWVQIQRGPAEGLWIKLNPRTGSALYKGEAERAVQDYLAGRIRAGGVFYDLGANCGFFSLLAARLTGSRGFVYSFEPENDLAERVRENMVRNGFANFAVTESAVWKSSGNVRFVRADTSVTPDRGTGQIASESSGGTSRESVSVPAISIDDFAASARPPDFIKCDVEGAETEALRGASKTLARVRPIVICEIHSPENDVAVRRLFAELGYLISNVDGNHIAAEPPMAQSK